MLDNFRPGFATRSRRQAPLFVGDVGDESLVSQLMDEHRVKAVMHFAASSVVPDSVANPIGYYSNNTAGSLALTAAVARAGVRYFVFSSTAAVYGNPAEAVGQRGFHSRGRCPPTACRS